jgi:hypothetical protein
MTISRWERAGILPPSVAIGGRKFWRLRDLEELERKGNPGRSSAGRRKQA